MVTKSNSIDWVYRELRNMATTFRLLPGQRLNETTLAKELGVSRTPVREALNRLRDEEFVTYSADQGFFRKPLNVKEVFDLYEFRQQIEMSAVRLAVKRANVEQLLELEGIARQAAEEHATFEEIASLDEEFHSRLTAITGNVEMQATLRKVNDHIRYVRWMDIGNRSVEITRQYKELVRYLRERNTEGGMRLMTEHIGLRMDHILDILERCYGRMHMNAKLQSNHQSLEV